MNRLTEPKHLRFGGHKLLSVAVCGLVGALSPHTFAQQNAGNVIEEVLVTANKRTERLVDAAGTINVVDANDISRIGATGLEDILALTPGAVFQKNQPDFAVVTIRGIGTQTGNNTTQLPTGSYVGDVPISDPTFITVIADPAPYDFARVEVLKGPQGVLYGTGALAGAIRYQFAAPSLEPGISGNVTGSFSAIDGGGTGEGLSAVLNAANQGGTTALRAVAFVRNDPGYINNVGAGVDEANEVNVSGGRVSLLLAPTDRFDATLTLHHQVTDADDSFGVNQPTDDFERTDALLLSPRETTFNFASAVVNFDLPFGTLTSVTGYHEKELDSATDQTLLINGIFGPGFSTGAASFTDSSSDAFSQEVRISSEPDSSISWVAGAFYQTYDIEQATSNQEVATRFEYFSTGFKGESKEYSIFADFELSLTDRLHLGIGARYFDTELSGDSEFVVFGAPSGLPAAADEDGVAPRASIQYDLSEDLVGYLRYTRGFRFGGANIVAPNPVFPSPSQFDSDTIDAYEVGMKGALSDALSMEVAAFFYDWQDTQVNVTRPDFFVYTDNVGSAETYGVEVNFQYRLESVVIDVSVTATEAETTTDLLGPFGDVTFPSGTPLPGTPDLQTYLAATWNFDMASKAAFLRVSHRYQGDAWDSLEQFNEVGDFHILSLDAGVDLSPSLSLLFHGKNLLDETGVVNTNFAPGVSSQFFVLQPRTISAEVQWRF